MAGMHLIHINSKLDIHKSYHEMNFTQNIIQISIIKIFLMALKTNVVIL